nr:MAG TPA: hypothetical protein [Bacteriophage sp.]
MLKVQGLQMIHIVTQKEIILKQVIMQHTQRVLVLTLWVQLLMQKDLILGQLVTILIVKVIILQQRVQLHTQRVLVL